LFIIILKLKITVLIFEGIQKLPIVWEKAPYHIRQKYLDRHQEYRNYSTGSRALHTEHLNIDQALKYIHGVNYRTCKK